ncbi:TIGR03016 family PEP-CTERM system-associated outer membrane protein [Scleromatobacter humisilvae]|uniref:TIGR03016 family PEP-CTERM system-associated outer membrane protein n=1 Tax=Scleromatobacter humisilvae TaxID=2897159 RepID=A0A9X2BZI4_9BURK|nr:TIGR03016 family PEP-CTERM system-associated outer membrane protein [Scleromatobacter humisilvae]MCK9686372.1 TIGR03016 family PEP-CTERM system-associated outer membrane protein [Scleromatobacter humisilvae]
MARAKPEYRNPRVVAIDRYRLTVLGLLSLAMFDAQAQPDSGGDASRPFIISPSVTVNETLTDNANLTATDRRADLVTQVSPSLQVRSAAGWAQGFLNYSLVGLNYARSTSADAIQQSLESAVQTQLLDHHLFIDGNASISRQNISAFGTQTPDAALHTDNQTQVASLSVTPYLQGILAGNVAYRLGGDYSITHSSSGAIGNSTNSGGSAHLGTAQTTARIGWGLDVSDEKTDFSEGRATTTKSAVGSLIFSPDGELQLTLRGGREGTDVESLNLKYDTTYGASVRWKPSDRTTLLLEDDKRYFGDAYTFSFQHRTAHTVWMIGDSRQVTNNASAASQGQLMTAFDLIYMQLASKYPDPVTRASQTLLELQALGLNPLVVVPTGFLTDAVSLQRTLSFSVGYIGLRTNILLSAQQSDTSRLDPLSTASDSLSDGSSVRQRTASLSASHRLTELSSLNLTLSDSRTLDRDSGAHVELRTATVNWITQLGLRTHFSLGARRSIAIGDSPYTEWALLATLNLQI